MSDKGRPAAADIGTPHASIFDDLAKKVVRQNSILQSNSSQVPNINIDW